MTTPLRRGPPSSDRPLLSPRDRALLRLDQARLPGWTSGLISRAPADRAASPRDAALAEAFYAGSVKMLLPLRYRIAHHAGKPLRAIDGLVQKILVLGAWQLLGMDQIPPAIAVDQAVEQCRRFGRARAAGFVNAVLRNISRQPPPVLPQSAPLPEQIELTLGLPRALVQQFARELNPETAHAIAVHANLTPPTLLRLIGTATLSDLQVALQADTDPPQFSPHGRPGTVVALHARREHLGILSRSELAQVQDPTASSCFDLAELRPGMTVLDRCAGNGTKALHLREFIGEHGTLHAVEPDPARVARCAELIAARGYTNIHLHTAGTLADVGLLQPEHFDLALLDVPCSNSGVLARRPEARFHPPPIPGTSAQSLLRLQSDLLQDTADSVKVGGLLVYSTCSVWRSENHDQIRTFLDRDRRFVLKVERLTLPAANTTTDKRQFDPATWHDGGYVAVLVRDR